MRSLRMDSLAVHAGQRLDPATGAVTTPIVASSTFGQAGLNRPAPFEYARTGNPTRASLEEALAELEGGSFGLCFASGMAAISALTGVLSAGDHVVVSRNTYGGTYRYFEQVLGKFGVSFSWVDTTSPEALSAAFRPHTRMVFVETPTNPLMEITDIAAAARAARRNGAILVVDNTFMTPYFQRPLALGAHIVLHSTTKYLNGHSDCLGGALATSDPDLYERLRFIQNASGAVPSPFDCFLIHRGIKTLAVRMRRHEESAGRLAAFLAEHPKVKRVIYPGLPGHPGKKVHEAQAGGYGAIVTLDLGSFAAANRFLSGLRLFTLAESLGGVESLACHPESMTHASVPEALRKELGITSGLVRLSVGIEDPQDLEADLGQALSGVE